MLDNSSGERIGVEIKVAMLRNNRSQKDLANAIGMSQAGLSRRINGEVDFTVTELKSVAKALDVPFTALAAPEELAS